MPAEFEIEDKIDELLQSDLQGFQCPVCRHREFAIFDEPGSHLRTNLLQFEGDDPVARHRTRLITMAYTNCGHIEQFAEEPLRRRAVAALQAAT
jgi:hypothetical protein